jgi:hypothetical protein
MLPSNQKAGKNTGGDHDIRAALHKRERTGDEIVVHAVLRGLIPGEPTRKILGLAAKPRHVNDTVAEAIQRGLLVVPDLADRVECHQAEAPAKLRRSEQCRLARSDDRNIERGAKLVEAGILDVPHHEGVEAALLGCDAVVDGLDSAA